MNHTANRRSRLLSCMGSAQLVTAMAAATERQARFAHAATDDYLVVHDLFAPDGQEIEFAACIEKLARSAGSWKKIVHIPSQAAADLDVDTLREKLSLESVDEMFLGQNRVVVNRLLADAFPNASTFCYGDSMGINFSTEYFAPRRRFPRLHALRQSVKSFLRSSVGSQTTSRGATRNLEIRFDDYYLVLANRFDETVPHHTPISPGNFRQLYHRFGQELELTSGWAHELEKVTRTPGEVIVLMTTNFSESGKMTLDAELAAYEKLVPSAPQAALVLKPHPRDSRRKIDVLRDRFSPRFRQLIVLHDPTSFYLPFEAVFDRFFANRPDAPMPRLICVSSVCLPFELIYGVPCDLGFGDRIVRKHFRSTWVSQRLEHEQDLQAVVRDIRNSRQKVAA